MAWTQSDLDALESAIKGGVKRVQYGDRAVEYHSMREMLDLRDTMKNAVAASTSNARVGCTIAQFTKG